MRNILTLLVILGLSLPTAWAQHWQLGVRAGLAACNITPGRYFDPLWRSGLSAGLVANRPLSEHFSLQPELLFTLANYQFNEESSFHGNPLYPVTCQLQSLALPLLASYRWRSVFVEAGPQASLLLRGKLNGIFHNEHFSRWEAAAAVGVGWRQRQGLLLGLRYTHGLTAIMGTQDGYDQPNYSRSLQLYAGYVFHRRPSAAGH